MSEVSGERKSRFPRWVPAVPILFAALCILAILPLLYYAPVDASAAFLSGKAVATIALVAYPVALTTLATVAHWAKKHGWLALGSFRLLFWFLHAAFIASLGVATVLMWPA